MLVFNKEFVEKAQNVLRSKCLGTQTLFKKDFAKYLGFNIEDSKNLSIGLNIISAMFDMNYFKEYKVIPGKYGGIVHEPTFYRDAVIQSFPDGFLEVLLDTMNRLCSDIPVSRNKIAQTMNLSLDEKSVCAMISVALQKRYIVGFSGKVGKNGGIIKQKDIAPKITIDCSKSFSNKTISESKELSSNAML